MTASSSAGAPRHLQIVTEIGPGVVTTGDDVRLKPVISNLLDSASKHTPDSGRTERQVQCKGPDALVREHDNGVARAWHGADLLHCLFKPLTQGAQSLDRPYGVVPGSGHRARGD